MVVHDICSTMPRFTASSTKAARVASANRNSIASRNALGFPSHATSCAEADSQRFRHYLHFLPE